jgi:dTDP-4-dehydrorhamnose reductase
VEEALDRARPWALLDVRDPDRVCAGAGACRSTSGADLAEPCARRGVPLVFISGAEAWHPVEDKAGVLEIRTGSLFMPWDRHARAVEILDALDAGRTVEIDAAAPWNGVYGPDVVDVALDLLLDGVSGAVPVRPAERVSLLDFARALAATADADAGLIVATGKPRPAPLFGWSGSHSYLPPLETMLERFVRECRTSRAIGEIAVERRDDDVRLQAAE